MRIHNRPIQCRFCGAHIDHNGQVLQEGRPCPASQHEAHPLVVLPRLFGRGWRGEYKSFRRDLAENELAALLAVGIKPE